MCDICYKWFCSRRALKNHNRLHTGELPYECGVYGQRYVNSGRLARHRGVHTRPFECSLCGQRFTQNCHLTAHTHMRIHTGLKPFDAVCVAGDLRRLLILQITNVYTVAMSHSNATFGQICGFLWTHKNKKAFSFRGAKPP